MKKHTLKKALALLVILAMVIPCLPILASAETTVTTHTFRDEDKAWYDNDTDKNGNQEDTDDGTFYISNANELAYFMSLGQGENPVQFEGKTIKLKNNIIWNEGVASSTGFTPSNDQDNKIYGWAPYAVDGKYARQFKGVFDGQGHTISGLYITKNTDFCTSAWYLGLFGKINNATIKNLTIENSYMQAENYSGLIVGGYRGTGECKFENISIEKCYINGGTDKMYIGGICGGRATAETTTLTFNNCVIDANTIIKGKNSVGGILGASLSKNHITMTDCINYASLTAETEVAGLAGRISGSAEITRCVSFGAIKGTTTATMWKSSAALVSLRRCDDGNQITDTDATTGKCVLVKFTDCYRVKNANSTLQYMVAILNGGTTNEILVSPDYKVEFYYSDKSSDEPVLSEEYYKGCSLTETIDGEKTTYTSPYTLSNNLEKSLVEEYSNAIVNVPAGGTDLLAIDTKIEGLQIRKNTSAKTFDARFVSSIKFDENTTAANIEEIGFQIVQLNKFAAGTDNAKQDKVCEAVYASIQSNYGMTTVSATDYSANYLGTLVVEGIPSTGIQTVLVRSYYKTATATVFSDYAVVTFVNGNVAGSTYVSTAEADTITHNPVEGASQALASSYNTETYDLAPLLPEGASDISVKASKGQTVNGTTVSLNVGENYFEVTYTEGGEEKSKTIAIARRAGHRVVFNSNGGSYIAPQSVADGGKLTYNDSFEPKREGYEFLGWFKQDGTRFYFDSGIVNEDLMLVAHWQAPSTPAATDTSDAHVYTTSSAAINVVWKDYANAFSARPASMTCTLSDGTNSYKVVVTENNASFVNGAPDGAEINTGAGNWTVKITGLDGTKNYTFTADDLSTNAYEKQQSGTAVTYTLNGYKPMLDDSAWLMTQNGRLYDYAGNVVVLKGVVTYNVGWSGFADNVSIKALERLQKEGVNCIRVTMFVETEGNNHGYHMANGSLQTEARRIELRTMLKVAIDNASSLGMYCIVDWGILASIEMTDAVNATAKELFVTLATDYKDNPYVIYEICNEPAPNTWSSTVVPYAKDVIAAIREHSNALVILAPDAAATNLSEYSSNPGDDPIDKPLDTALSYSVAYTYHCYAASHKYSGKLGETFYGWKIKDALDAGLTLVLTEFSPAELHMGSESMTIDKAEANKFLNVILENDMSFMLFRYMSGDGKDSAQYMFQPNHTDDLNNGTWTYDMLQNSGKWFYDNALDSNGFIKAADFGD